MIKLSLIIFVLIPLLQCVGVFALNYSPLLDKIVINLAKSRVPSEVSNLKLIRGAEELGLKFSSLASVMRFADEKDLLGVADASFDQLAPALEGAALRVPNILALTAQALRQNPAIYFTTATVSLLTASAGVAAIGEGSALEVALQTVLFLSFGLVLPGTLIGCGLLARLHQAK